MCKEEKLLSQKLENGWKTKQNAYKCGAEHSLNKSLLEGVYDVPKVSLSEKVIV